VPEHCGTFDDTGSAEYRPAVNWKHVKGRGRGLTEGTVREGLRKTVTSGCLDLPNALPSRSAARRLGTRCEYSQLLRSHINGLPFEVHIRWWLCAR
jgi:hypothetical protein